MMEIKKKRGHTPSTKEHFLEVASLFSPYPIIQNLAVWACSVAREAGKCSFYSG
jgi:hypothetical protein